MLRFSMSTQRVLELVSPLIYFVYCQKPWPTLALPHVVPTPTRYNVFDAPSFVEPLDRRPPTNTYARVFVRTALNRPEQTAIEVKCLYIRSIISLAVCGHDRLAGIVGRWKSQRAGKDDFSVLRGPIGHPNVCEITSKSFWLRGANSNAAAWQMRKGQRNQNFKFSLTNACWRCVNFPHTFSCTVNELSHEWYLYFSCNVDGALNTRLPRGNVDIRLSSDLYPIPFWQPFELSCYLA